MPFGSMSLLSCLNGFHGTSVARTVRWRTEAKRTYHHDSSTPRCLPSPTALWVQGIVACCSSVHGCCPFGIFLDGRCISPSCAFTNSLQTTDESIQFTFWGLHLLRQPSLLNDLHVNICSLRSLASLGLTFSLACTPGRTYEHDNILSCCRSPYHCRFYISPYSPLVTVFSHSDSSNPSAPCLVIRIL